MAELTKAQKVMAFVRKARGVACIASMWGPAGGASKAERAEQDKLMAREDMDNLVRRAREEIDQLNRDRMGAKSRIISMRQTGVEKIKIIPHMQALKRLEARITQKNKLLQNIEASADTASDADLIIETAKAQKSMLGVQKNTLAQAFNGTDVDELVDELQEHHDDVHDISQTLSDMQLGGGGLGGGAGSEEITEEDFDEWMTENADVEINDVPMVMAPSSGETGSYASMGMVAAAMPGVPMAGNGSSSSAATTGISSPDRATMHGAAGVRPRKAKVAQMTL